MRLILLDDHRLFAESLKLLLEEDKEIESCEFFTNIKGFMEEISKNTYDIVLLDINLKEKMTGLDLIGEILKINSEAKIVILTSYDLINYKNEALKQGARAFINKSVDIKDLKDKLVAVDKGYIEKASRDLLVDLSPREREVLKELVLGDSKKNIAKKLFISERTLYNHIGNIYDKLGVNNSIEAYDKALRLGYLDPII